MEKNIPIAIICLFTLLFISCKENETLEYENDPALYFVNERYVQGDSIDHSFFTIPGNGPDTVYILMQTMGYVYDFDRPFLLEQTNTGDADAAVAGVHYVPFNDAQVSKYFVIPANQVRIKLPIILLRDKSLESQQVRLELGVTKNEYFRPGIEQWSKFLVKTTSKANKPSTWDSYWKYQFGASWGPVKMRFIIDVTGYTDWEVRPADMAFAGFLGSKVLSYFLEYNKANPDKPLKEADGTLVSFTD